MLIFIECSTASQLRNAINAVGEWGDIEWIFDLRMVVGTDPGRFRLLASALDHAGIESFLL